MKLALFTTLFTAGLMAHAGGSAEGGGNTYVALSTEAQVLKAIEKAKKDFTKEFIGGALDLIADKETSQSAARAVVRAAAPKRILEIADELHARDKWLGIFGLAKDLVEKTKIEKKTDGPCKTADGAHAEGAVNMRDPSSPVCLSVLELRRLPSALLRQQVLALLVHEYMHKLGFGEKDAHLMQMYALAEVANGLSRNRTEVARQIDEARNRASSLQKDLSSRNTDDACMLLRMLSDTRKSLEIAGHSSYSNGLVSEEDAEKHGRALSEFYKAFEMKTRLSRPYPGGGTQYHILKIDEAFCMGRVTKAEVLERLEEIERLAKAAMPTINTLFRPGMTMTEGGAK